MREQGGVTGPEAEGSQGRRAKESEGRRTGKASEREQGAAGGRRGCFEPDQPRPCGGTAGRTGLPGLAKRL